MAQEKVRREDIIAFAHQIDDANVHPAVDISNRNKLVATNAATGVIELIPKSDVTPNLTHFCYIAWRDSPGVGFTLIPNIDLPYEAILITHEELITPIETDFEGYWRERLISTDITMPDHNDLSGLNQDDYVHHTATEITQHPYLNAENVFTGLINAFNDIKLNGGTADKYLKVDTDKKIIYVDLPSLINNFLGLEDVIPTTYVGADQNVPIVNETEQKLEFIETEEILTKVVEFVDSSDVPNDYTGHEGDLVRVNATANGLEFIEDPNPNSGDGYFYFGDKTVDGSWRMGISGVNFVIEIRVTGSWIPKETYIP